MNMNKTKELAWELGQKLGEVAEDAYKQGYSNGIKDGNINNDTFSEKVNEAYNNGLNDAWEAARKVANMTKCEYCKIFERDFKIGVLGRIAPAEAIQKIREYESRQSDPVINIQMGEQSDKVDCYNTDCINCINHNDCDYEDQTPRQSDEIKDGDEIANDYEKRESCENCKYGYKPSYTEPCYSCGNGKDGYEPLDENITTALCSLHKIQSSDGQEYVQLYDVLETVRSYMREYINKDTIIEWLKEQDIIKMYSQEQEARKQLDKLPNMAIPNKTGHWIEDEYEMEVRCSACGEENDECSKYCPNCGVRMD